MSKIVILGAGESGAGAAVLAKKEGFEVFVSDMSKIKDNYKTLMDDHGIEWEEGHHTEEKILDADEVIKSPGIPKEAPMIQKLMAKGTPIISEIEFAGRYTDAKMICITGSNGKTTTTSLIYHIIKSAGYDVGLAGNIGKSLALQVAETPHKYYVIELSSFQLDNMYEFRANVAILDGVRVSSWGSMVPLNQVANVTVPDPRTIAIRPWDKKAIKDIEKAIMDSGVGITPENNGEIVRLGIPQPTGERRKELVKQCNKIAERAKIEVRNVRQEIKEKLKKAIKDGLSEDLEKDAENDLQKIHDKYIKQLEGLMDEKEKEIMTV